MRNVPLYDVVSTILPGDSVTALLQAALWPGPESRGAWERWRRATGSFADFLRLDRGGLKRILPLLEYNLRLHRTPMDGEAGPILRAAALREEVRFRSFSTHGRAGLEGLAAAGIEPIVLKGAAAAALYYPSPGLRHCHDLDILVSSGWMPRIADSLAAAGFPTTEPIAPTPGLRFIHRSGLPIECHASPFRSPCYPVDLDSLRARGRSAVIFGSTCRVLGAGDMLAHICGHALQNPRRLSMTWLLDAYLLIDREPDPWPSFLDAATSMRIELPAALILTYLRDRLKARVPDAVLTRLRREAAATTADLRRAAIAGTCLAGDEGVRRLWHSSGWRSRFAILRWFLSSRDPLRMDCGYRQSFRMVQSWLNPGWRSGTTSR
jgi:hypothetical protein